MSTRGREMDAKLAGSRSFVGTLKRLFMASHRSEDGAKVGEATSPSQTPTRAPHITSPEAGRDSLDIQLTNASEANGTFPSPFSSRKSLDRQLFSSNSGPLISTFQRNISVAKAPLHHSISDSCENSSVLTNSQRLLTDDAGWPFEQPQKQLQSHLGRGARGSPLKLAARADASLPSLYDSPSRTSLDVQSVAISSPALTGASARPKHVLPVPLPSVEAPAQREGHQPPNGAVDMSAGVSPSPTTTLLALCPGATPAMRRRHWSLEDYEITRRIYKGSSSAVYKATCRRSGIPVALKVYSLTRVPPNVLHMIVREIKIHVELVHKHIVMLYGAFQDEKRLVLVQEYAGRGDMYGIYRSLNRRMTEAQLTHLVLAPFMDALSYLHGRGICHRDIKPENILFSNDWRLMIADFGVSIDLNQERAVTRAGTLEYMAPEVERCPLKMLPEENKENKDLAYTTAVDIWATGVLAYELMVGFPPFVVDNATPAGGAGPGAGASGVSTGRGGMFLAEYANRRTLSFPASTSSHAREFISLALAERPEERPTSLQLSRHPWLAAAMQQPASRRSLGQLNSFNVVPMQPSRLGSPSMASGPNSSAVAAAALAV
ncbi:hypothetical protein VaNZ11_012754 [Volvox africanus]|uniref:Protein kinase domain-containing protein n=1 Tax=Volvox africanus TaxID=51714 RepID=A0ABQ5SEK6_9CHLO|nr:hypothetical protein VaNZ11_012754 [Volvox africanus]